MIITSKFLEKYFQEHLSPFNTIYDIEIVIYKDFSHVLEIYNSNANVMDGFLVSGKFAKAAITKGLKFIEKPVVSIDLNLENIYKTLLNLLIHDRNLDFNRVFFDFQIPIGKEISVKSVLKIIDKVEGQNSVDEFIETLKFEQIILIEENLKRAILQFKELGSVDFIICQFTNIIPFLEKNNIPYIYPHPSSSYLMNTFDHLVNIIKIDKLEDNYPAIITVEFESDIFNKDITIIQEFLINNGIDFNTEINGKDLRFFLTAKELKLLTDNYTNSKISELLKSKSKNKFHVSYSIGKTLTLAIENSETSAKEAKFRNGSFLMDSNKNLIGPLSSDKIISVNRISDENLINISKKTGLSLNSLQKVKAIMKNMENNQINSNQLSGYLGSTVRNANRILKTLESSGFAKATFRNNSNSKGRPSKIYTVNL